MREKRPAARDHIVRNHAAGLPLRPVREPGINAVEVRHEVKGPFVLEDIESLSECLLKRRPRASNIGDILCLNHLAGGDRLASAPYLNGGVLRLGMDIQERAQWA